MLASASALWHTHQQLMKWQVVMKINCAALAAMVIDNKSTP